MIAIFLSWYLVVQLISLVTLPLTSRLFINLPDRGYAFAKSLGILLVGFILWLGTSYGILRNETGGAWLAFFIVAIISLTLGWSSVQDFLARASEAGWRSQIGQWPWYYIRVTEVLFFAAFVALALVRAHDPAANHTEQPMDLMFMNGIWNSATFPPKDPWLSGYAISYYYFGYWLLTTLGRLAGQPPETAFNIGQACWYGLLLLGSFGVGYNLIALHRTPDDPTEDDGIIPASKATSIPTFGIFGGFLTAIAVGVIGNLQVLFEWLHANGYNITRVASWFAVYNFPERAEVTEKWFIGSPWWWWRSSRVIEDRDLMGGHIEVIDEFPMFSYVLGDNHPHVLAMPFVLLLIGLALNLFLNQDSITTASHESRQNWSLQSWTDIFPLGLSGLLIMLIATGGLLFFNTWDFPSYWLLVLLCLFIVTLWRLRRLPTIESSSRSANEVGAFERFSMTLGGNSHLASALMVTAVWGGMILIGTLIIYFPYFLTAQSQAGGLVPNFFNPTRFPQFLLMFGAFLPGICALVLIAWQTVGLRPQRVTLISSLALTLGLPVAFLVLSVILATGTSMGQNALQRMALPEGETSHLPFIIERWTSQSLTFLIVGILLSLVVALVWQYTKSITNGVETLSEEKETEPRVPAELVFSLFLAGIGLLLVYAPEFVYLRDNFGTRMNTVFKFYYQAWLLLAISSTYSIVLAYRHLARGKGSFLTPAPLLGSLSLLLIMMGLLFPISATYSKTGGFGSPEPTFDATAYIRQFNPTEFAVLEWVRQNTAIDALILEGKGASYRADYNRVSTVTGRPTLLGWDGHESQWRGEAFGEMAQWRPETLNTIYRDGSTLDIERALREWQIDYVYIGPTERNQYGITPPQEERLRKVMDLAFEAGDVRLYKRRGE